jgi:hypothetical protein
MEKHNNSHHTKRDGDKGVYKSILDLHEKGYIVNDPLTEHAPFDLIIWRDCEAKTVQVKYRTKNKRGVVEVLFRRTQWNTDGSYNEDIDKDPIDLYCVYCPDTDECYYFDPDQFGKSISLRIDEPKNNQKKGVNMASDFKQVP